jgi:hypothetical protein
MIRGIAAMNDLRLDARDEPWPTRPWIMAALCAVAGLLFWLLVGEDADPGRTGGAIASGLAVSTVAFVLTVEARRWAWALGFAVGWGAVIGLIAYVNTSYGRVPTIFEWPFFAGIFAVLLAAPLFQSLRDHGSWRFPASTAHQHVWTDAVIGALAFAFVGVSFLLTLLIAALFNLIGINLLQKLFEEGWFILMLAGAAFGGAVGLLRERDALVATIHRLAMTVLGVLAPVLAAALTLFLVSLPVTGLTGLWDSWASAAALTLAAAVGAMVLANAALGQGGEGQQINRVLRIAALALTLVVLPLALLATTAMMLRIGQYGWTPERIWGVLAALAGLAFGLAGWWAVGRDRLGFGERLHQLQIWIGMDQLARLRSGAVQTANFDYTAMAFDFGPAGRAALERMTRATDATRAANARLALAADNRYDMPDNLGEDPNQPVLAQRLRVSPAGSVLSDRAVEYIDQAGYCRRDRCLVYVIADDRLAVYGMADRMLTNAQPRIHYIRETNNGEWMASTADRTDDAIDAPSDNPSTPDAVDLDTATIEIRAVQRRQVFVNGEPQGEIFE